MLLKETQKVYESYILKMIGYLFTGSIMGCWNYGYLQQVPTTKYFESPNDTENKQRQNPERFRRCFCLS